MNRSLDKVLRHLAGNENIETISINDLQKLADENPYFPVAQFVLSKKLKAENHISFSAQAQKTALYFSNPYWLHYQLVNESQQDKVLNENLFFDKTKENYKNADEEEKAESAHEASVAPNEKLETVDKEKASQPEEEMAAIARYAGETTDPFLSEAGTTDETFNRDNIENVIPETEIPATFEINEVMEEMAGASRETDEMTEAFLNEAQISAEDRAEQPPTQTGIPPFTSKPFVENIKDENIEPDEHERMFQNIKAMLDATSEEADADVKDAVIPIDPYYTIDYFASQGIKLDLDQNPKDQLGQNLKKFTHWLKHMKKLGPEDATEVIARTQTEADIPKIAESSNTVREVVTEAMASVLEKQGKNDKAIELYKKLSFLNPHKSAYFAAKIKNLKGI